MSLAFWMLDSQNRPFFRAIGSAHGLLYCLGFGCAVVASSFTEPHLAFELADVPLVVLVALGAASTIASFAMYSGPRWAYLLHTLGLPAGAWLFFIGGMFVTHDWL